VGHSGTTSFDPCDGLELPPVHVRLHVEAHGDFATTVLVMIAGIALCQAVSGTASPLAANVIYDKCPQRCYLGELQAITQGGCRPNYPPDSSLDPLLGIFTGVFAYYLYETNPRTAPAQEQKLDNLVRWKIEKYYGNRAKTDPAGTSSDVEWSELVAEAKHK
jgi:hypothetical protein